MHCRVHVGIRRHRVNCDSIDVTSRGCAFILVPRDEGWLCVHPFLACTARAVVVSRQTRCWWRANIAPLPHDHTLRRVYGLVCTFVPPNACVSYTVRLVWLFAATSRTAPSVSRLLIRRCRCGWAHACCYHACDRGIASVVSPIACLNAVWFLLSGLVLFAHDVLLNTWTVV